VCTNIAIKVEGSEEDPKATGGLFFNRPDPPAGQ